MLYLQGPIVSPRAEVDANYVFFLDVSQELTQIQLQQLTSLLQATQAAPISNSSAFSFWVVPRMGTISPWSSKATDILHICGFTQVERVERGILYRLKNISPDTLSELQIKSTLAKYHDALTESVIRTQDDFPSLFRHEKPRALEMIDLTKDGLQALQTANKNRGLVLSDAEINYLYENYQALGRNPSDVELMMFAQVNSEHCRHKIFNAQWWIDGKQKDESLFDMIRYTYQQHPDQALIAYKDNAAVLKGSTAERLTINPHDKIYRRHTEYTPFVLKVETHNHPTAIAPFPGAATGSGGEIRDEAATGRGAFSKAGLSGFSVSHLQIPQYRQPWEIQSGKPAAIASPLEIMLQGPIGAASFSNEFGRPTICGYFRTFEMKVEGYYGQEYRGYHKPIMIAGGLGSIRESLVNKKDIPVGALVIVLGGPGMAIGLGGGAASSRVSSETNESLDFASVQRANPEMQRRCQEVINACSALEDKNPILSIHDVGAGGLSNALPELVAAAGLGATIHLRDILLDEPGMSPLEIWCNESQERYVLAIQPEGLALFTGFCERERCPFSVVGASNAAAKLLVNDAHFKNKPIDLPMSVLFEKMPRMICETEHAELKHLPFEYQKLSLDDAIKRVLTFPCVANKNFLITIGDRSVGGLVTRDQMVGPWQVPVADVAVTSVGFTGYKGEAMAMGERTPIALLHPAASARMAVAEAITNIAAASIEHISQIALSANWMSAAGEIGEGAALYDAVQAIAKELCPALGISIPVGKDSLSMKTKWQSPQGEQQVVSPLSLIITAAAPVSDVRRTLTPVLNTELEDSRLLLIDLGGGCNCLGGSVLAQVYQELGSQPPDLDSSRVLKQFFHAIQALNQKKLIHAYHDRSDGGLLVTVCEMMFASHVGITLDVAMIAGDLIPILFAEELGAVIQVAMNDLVTVMKLLESFGLRDKTYIVGQLNQDDELHILKNDSDLSYCGSRTYLQSLWSEVSYRMQCLRDNSACADQEFENILDAADPGLNEHITFKFTDNLSSFVHRPRVAILREQGVNGHMEMAAAFMQAGFEAVDVHMTDLLTARVNLDSFVGLAACGGFSYGDVLGAGRGWAQSILMHEKLREKFSHFFNRADTFTLGVCNGCQMLSQLKSIIPGALSWPSFQRNLSEQFEARYSLLKIEETPSIFFKDMAGSVLPVVVSHGEGRAVFENIADVSKVNRAKLVACRYVNHRHEVTTRYPFNPNGSHQGITALSNEDGRVLIMMPHPERVFRTVQNSWHPKDWGEEGPWIQLFRNVRSWCN